MESWASPRDRHPAGPFDFPLGFARGFGKEGQARKTPVAPTAKLIALATISLTTTYEDKPSWLFSHHFNDDSFVALAVEFGVEDLLPGAEV